MRAKLNIMGKYLISGIQQVGIGTEDFRKSWNWYIEKFGVNTKILEDDTVAERMLPYTGGEPQKRHACIAMNMQGGGGFEIWQYSERKPQPCKFAVAAGDLGIFAAKIKCRNIEAFHKKLKKTWNEVSEIAAMPNNALCFYVKDLYGNCFQVVERGDVYLEQNKLNGGIVGVMIGVTDMKRSIAFYNQILGFDTIIYDKTGVFEDWQMLEGAQNRYRRVLLATSSPRRGAFSGVFGDSTIELVQAIDRTPRKIYEGRFWGDPGFIQLCFDVSGMKELGKFCAKKGYPFTVDSCPSGEVFDMGEASGHFTYIEDPDGTLIEFVETHRIPIVKKLNWYLDMRKRNRNRQLPKILFRLMAMVSKQKIK